MKKLLLATAAVLAMAYSGTAYANEDGLPSCDDTQVKSLVMEQASILGFGNINRTWTDIFYINRVQPMGINRNNGMKFCRAYITCDLDKAKELEKNVIGPHNVTRACYVAKQNEDAGNPAWADYSIRTQGEGGAYIVTLTN